MQYYVTTPTQKKLEKQNTNTIGYLSEHLLVDLTKMRKLPCSKTSGNVNRLGNEEPIIIVHHI